MCLTTANPPKIAEEDMTVYKYVHMNILNKDRVMAPFFSFTYILGVLYKEDMIANYKKYPSCYDTRAGQQERRQKIRIDGQGMYGFIDPNIGAVTISRGFHSARTINRLGSANLVVECTIPKGSIYYEDGDGLLVSNQIIVNKII